MSTEAGEVQSGITQAALCPGCGQSCPVTVQKRCDCGPNVRACLKMIQRNYFPLLRSATSEKYSPPKASRPEKTMTRNWQTFSKCSPIRPYAHRGHRTDARPEIHGHSRSISVSACEPREGPALAHLQQSAGMGLCGSPKPMPGSEGL